MDFFFVLSHVRDTADSTHEYIWCLSVSYYISSIEQELVFSSTDLICVHQIAKLPTMLKSIKKITEDTQVATPTTRIHLAY